MGNSLSRQNRNTAALSDMATKTTPGQEPPQPMLSRDTLIAALNNVAKYVRKEGRDVKVVAVGGAVNTIYLQSRGTTHDVDFFNHFLSPEELDLLIKGAKHAVKKDKRLEEQWLNNHTVFFIPTNLRANLTQQSINQRVVVFQEPGLTVYAAPWNYAFCCKVDRLAGAGTHKAPSYDLDDAVRYLNLYLKWSGLPCLPPQTLKGWFDQYSLGWTSRNDAVLLQVSRAYKVLFNVDKVIV